ncbi:hypothetical protein B1812_21575 (plasmid) [Methylocystis bryophila]|uniref:Condensation domain-containing protein n=1 Tax=Methylocystis bryophila TaxID=655015 RepID=A0A1W6N222_9HYPH|nr:hypothetical protein B1812_21575 [Methylocystis bryophila]
MVLRTDLSGDPSFRTLLARVRETALGAQAHQDLPFERLVEEVQPVRDLSRDPLFQVMFVLQNAPMQELTLSGLRAEPVATESGASKFDLTLAVIDTGEGLNASFEYATALFDAGTIERLAGALLHASRGDRRRSRTAPQRAAAVGRGGAPAHSGGVEPDRRRLSQGSSAA